MADSVEDAAPADLAVRHRGDDALELFRQMVLIREFEDAVRVLYRDNEIPGFVHLSHGQEGCAVGVVAALRVDDLMTTSHRGHGHLLAKGVEPRTLMAELFGRSEGVSGGFGGSMHAMSLDKGILGANGIVGPGAAIAVGGSLALRNDPLDRICVGLFGDGALTTGSLHEAMILGGQWRTPCLLVCEDNGYVEFSRYSELSPLRDVDGWARLYGWKAISVDGSDVRAVRASAREAIALARKGQPTFLHVRVSRLRNHFEGDQGRYRSPTESLTDPIEHLESALTEDQVAEVRSGIRRVIEDATAFARRGTWPKLSDLGSS